MPADPTTHPSAQDLLAFGQGKLSGDAAETVAQHLETCDACRSSVANAPADSFVGLVQAAKRKAPGGTRLPGASRLGASPSLMSGVGAAPAPPLDVPPALAEHPRFRIVRELGRGGMGVVYQAEHRLMERTVAIKVISRSVLEHPEALARFHGEVKAAAQLQHPNIVAAHDAEQAGDLHMLVMEYVEGIDLAKVLEKKGPLPVRHACHYVRQAALGLQHAFERGMVHRDIKPQNLMLTPKGQVKILDFGLARMARKPQQGRGITQADQFMGTPEYVAPEQATDARSADVRADIYSLGCTLYCLLAGRPPFVEETVIKLVLAHIEKEATPLHEVRPEVSPELSAVVARMLAKNPAERFQTPAEVVQALTPFCKPAAKEAAPPASPERETRLGSDTPVAKPSLVNRSELGRPKREEQRPQPSGRHPSSGGRRRWAVLVAAGMALPLLLAGIIIVIKWTAKKDGSTEFSVVVNSTKDTAPQTGATPSTSKGTGDTSKADLTKPPQPPKDPAPPADDFVPLFNGKDMTGWQPFDPDNLGDWNVTKGELRLSAKEDKPVLYETEREYTDFCLRAKVFSIPGKNNSVRIRASSELWEFYAISFGGQTHVPGKDMKIGSILKLNTELADACFAAGKPFPWQQPSNPVTVKDYNWFRLEVEARGSKITIRVDDKIVLAYKDPGPPWKSGKIRLGAGPTPLRIQTLEIKELPAE